MGIQPIIPKRKGFGLKACSKCGQLFGEEGYAPTKSFLFADGVIPICNQCVDEMLADAEWDWDAIDKLCQLADIPFVPREWERLREMKDQEVFYRYARIFLGSEYEGIGWSDYYKAFRELREAGRLEEELPEVAEQHERELKEKWGANYDNEALLYLEGLFNGLLSTQTVNGALQIDQAKKICKMSYEVDRRIAEGSDFDKLLASYDKLVKAAEFTPKNAKNINDFDTFGEAIKWLEKKGWRNTFYDNVTRDVVDETIKNFQNFNQRLYVNESSMGDEITRRLEALKQTAELEQNSYYDTDKKHDLDQFDVDGYNVVFDNEEFKVEVDDE